MLRSCTEWKRRARSNYLISRNRSFASDLLDICAALCRRFSLWLRRREISPRLFISALFVVVVTKAHWIIVLLHFKQTTIDSSLCFQRASEALCSIKKQSFVAERLTNLVVELKHSLLFFNFTQNDKTWNSRNETAEKKCEKKNFAKDYVRRSGSKLNCSNDKVSAFSAVHKKPVFPSALCEVVANFPPKRIFSMSGLMRGKRRNNYQKLILFVWLTSWRNAVYFYFFRKSTITSEILYNSEHKNYFPNEIDW